jgi:Tol biopolymer transport system component
MNRITALLVVLLAPALFAQGPSAEWRTIALPHFRVHYPAEYEAWAMRAAERLEAIRKDVSSEVGFTPPQIIDVLITNPIAEPNGSAWPLLDTPRMIFYAEPPGPDEQLGAYGHWIDVLSVHETAHLVHMLRPSRNPLERMMEKSVLPFNPITLRAPRWVLEGYATVVEGRLTGAGRPTSTIRALILRRWAESGRLPTYGQLDSDQRFLGMSMAYLMGSAYLEWLEGRSSSDALRNLWSRMTARQRRSFDEAFTGVFGDRPDRLYGEFLAELTASAMTLRRASVLQEGTLFQETPRASGEPAVSPDGAQIAVVLRAKDQPQKLVIWTTDGADEEEKKYEERIDKILARDPEDVAPLRAKPLPRKAVHSLTMPDGGDIRTPRWTRDGKAVLFAHRAPDAEGVLHFDLYRWDFERLTRITRLADVRDADPIDARTAVAVRSRYGASQMVTVDLVTGEVTPRGEASIDHVISAPHVSPDTRRIAHVAHHGGRWTLFVDDVPLVVPGDPASPAWLSNDELVVTLFARGFAELYRVSLTEGGTATSITRSAGGAFDPAPSPNGRIFFTSLDPDGYVVRVLTSRGQGAGGGGQETQARSSAPCALPPAPCFDKAPEPPPYDASLVPALSPLPVPRERNETTQTVAPGRPYGIGRQEWSWLAGQNFAPDSQSTEVGIRLGDVVGRLDVLGLASFGDVEGVAVAAAWRGWPVEIQVHTYRADDDGGTEIRGIWSRAFPRSRLTLEAGSLSSERFFAGGMFATRQTGGSTRFEEVLRVEADDDHYRATLGASVRSGSLRIAARYQHDGGDTVTLGGLPSSLLPRSAYALRVLDPALPVAVLSGDEYDGWRIETTVPGMPFTAFYQRHELDSARLALAGVEADIPLDPFPILKLPGLDLTAGVARIVGAPCALPPAPCALKEGATNWWLGMRWRP